MIHAVFDSGALDELLDDRVRHIFVEAFARTGGEMLLPAVVVPEFLAKYGRRDPVRAQRVLRIFGEPVSISGAHGARAAELRARALASGHRAPGVIDALVAALAEEAGIVVTRDRDDFAVLASAGRGFRIFDLGELRALLSSFERKRRPRRRSGRRS